MPEISHVRIAARESAGDPDQSGADAGRTRRAADHSDTVLERPTA